MKQGRDIANFTSCGGFSLVELVTSMVLTALILGVGVAAFSGAMNRRGRENNRTDALTSAQAALNMMSRQIANSGFGLVNNGLITSDCTGKRIHFRSNFQNRGSFATNVAGEDLTFYYDTTSQSIVRFDPNASATTSGVINQVSDVNFTYYDYDTTTSTTTVTSSTTCSANTARVGIDLRITLPDVQGQPTGRVERVTSDITLRNSPYMLAQY